MMIYDIGMSKDNQRKFLLAINNKLEESGGLDELCRRLGARAVSVIIMRSEGLKYREIGLEMNVGETRAAAIYTGAMRRYSYFWVNLS